MPQPANQADIPYHSNPDGMSCGQCVYRMILEYFRPDQNWSFDRMNEFCGAVPKKYTWLFRPIMKACEEGLEVQVYDTLDVDAFLYSPIKYLVAYQGEEGGRDALANSHMPSVLKDAAIYSEYLKKKKFEEFRRPYTAEDMRRLLDDGYLLNTWVNSAQLDGNKGYTGHFILVFGHDKNDFIAHDPDGRPGGYPNRRISADHLLRCGSPKNDGHAEGLVAIRDKRFIAEN